MADTPSPAETARQLAASLLDGESERQEHVDALDDVVVLDELPGVGGSEPMGLRAVVAAGGWSTITILFLLNLVDEFDRIALTILGPDVQDTFHINDTALTALNGVGAVAVFLAAIPLGVLADRGRRTFLIGVTSTLWAGFALLGGFTRNAFQLGATRIVNGIGKGNGPVVSSILSDRYPIEGRARVFALYGLANPVAGVVGPLLAAGVAAVAGGVEGWRWSLVILAVPAVVLAIAALGLPEPDRGGNEKRALGLDVEEPEGDAEPIPLSAAFERLRKVKTFAAMMSALGVLGFAISGAPTIFNLFLERHHDLEPFGRGVVASITSLGGIVGLALGGRAADRLFQRDPGAVLRLIGATMTGFGLLYTVGLYMPELWLLVAFHLAAAAMVAAPLAVASAVVAAVVPYRLRGVSFAVMGLYLVLVGGLLGGVTTGILSDAVGERTALTVLVPLACAGVGAFIASAAPHVRRDMSLVVHELREEQAERSRAVRRGATDDLLQVRDVDFSYGPVQVLFGVDLTVRRGETVALLGTNGAGKSTVLRVISGLALPDRGVVRLDGRTVTYSDATERVRRGIVQVPGGRAVFSSLTVAENLLAGAYSLRGDVAKVDAAVDDVLGLFPRLHERLDQPAGTLSGGEQQMLALAKALLLDPTLLLIDELSLGLAPVMVQEILETIDQLKARGVTMLIVEQSLNVALAVADRAVFMEKGQVRFEGKAADLLERDDLVRAVFLGTEGG